MLDCYVTLCFVDSCTRFVLEKAYASVCSLVMHVGTGLCIGMSALFGETSVRRTIWVQDT